MRPDPGTDTHGRVEVDKCVALFNVQLDEDTDARESLVVSTKATGVNASRTHRALESDAVDVGQGTSSVRWQRTHREPRACTGKPEASTFFVGEHHDRHRLRRLHATTAQSVDRT